MAAEKPAFDRIAPQTLASDIGSMTMMLYSVPRVLDHVDAIAVKPGLGEHWRITDAAREWNTNKTARRFLIAGIHPEEKMWVDQTVDTFRRPPYNLTRTEGVEIQPVAYNTRDQADWLVDQIERHDISSLGLFVSPYHLLRAYCTTLKAFDRNNRPPIPMIPVPVAVPPDTLIPETEVNAWDMVGGEITRIEAYQVKGDVATRGELQDYISWMWEQPLLSAVRTDSQ